MGGVWVCLLELLYGIFYIFKYIWILVNVSKILLLGFEGVVIDIYGFCKGIFIRKLWN